MSRLRRTIASVVLASLALAACTRDYDELFAESELADGGGRDARTDGTTGGDGSNPVLDGEVPDVPTGTDGGPGVDACTACNGPGCDIVCAGGCPCTNKQCAGPDCSFVCHAGPSCVVENTNTTSNATTTVTCKPGSFCDVTCNEPPCTINCEGNAQCKMTCLNAGGGTECILSCTGTLETGCDNSGGAVRRACNTTCPPPI